MHPSKRNPKLYFDGYDASKLVEALDILRRVYDFNYDSTRKSRLLETIIDKLYRLICSHCYKEDLPRGFIDS